MGAGKKWNGVANDYFILFQYYKKVLERIRE
jgi:hypothetical protein